MPDEVSTHGGSHSPGTARSLTGPSPPLTHRSDPEPTAPCANPASCPPPPSGSGSGSSPTMNYNFVDTFNTQPGPSPRAEPKRGGGGAVQVVVRVRPFLTAERVGPASRSCVQCLKDSVIIGNPIEAAAKPATTGEERCTAYAGGRVQQFHVSQAFNAQCSQVKVYEQSCRSIVKDIFLGINGCILAYGATGSGKTHIMFGDSMSVTGIIYQAMRDIFAEKDRLEKENGKVVKIKCSFLEIYNEEVFDLLLAPPHDDSGLASSSTNGTSSKTNKARIVRYPSPITYHPSPNASPQKVRVQLQARGMSRKDGEKYSSSENLHISGLNYVFPESLEEFARRIEYGHSNRVVATTDSNLKSSRSHAIITVEVKVLDRRGGGGSRSANQSQGTVARINFCDLAGSERAASTTNSGVKLREGGNINRSLLALSAMVRGLIQKKRHPTLQVFVPYRGSKLTRILSGSIGGNSRTLMLFCLSPCSNQYEESVNTMHFAMQVKQIQVSTKRNEYQVNSEEVAKHQEVLIDELYAEIAAMRSELARLKVVSQPPSLVKDGKYSAARSGEREGSGGAKSSILTSALVPSAPNESLAARICSPLQLSSIYKTQQMAQRTSKATATDMSLRSPLPLLSVASTVASFAEPVSPLTPMLNSAFRRMSSSDIISVPFSGHSLGPLNNNAQSNREAANPQPTGFMSRSSNGPSTSAVYSQRLSAECSEPAYTALEESLKRFAEEKEMFYHKMRDIQEQQSECDIRLRAHKWKLAQFLLNSSMSNRAKGQTIDAIDDTGRDTDDTPVGIIGLQQLIHRTEEEVASKAEELTMLSLELERCDHRIQEIKKKLLGEPTSDRIELLLENTRLRDSSTEAEGLAAQYYQESRVLLNRQSEYIHTLSLAVGAIRALLPNVCQDRVSSHLVEHARSVLLYALLPAASTSDMIPIFDHSLHADNTALLPPLHPSSSPQLSQSQDNASRHPSRRSDSRGRYNEKQKLQEQYEQLVETAELFRSSFSSHERGMRRGVESTGKTEPHEDSSKDENSIASSGCVGSGGEEDGAPSTGIVKQVSSLSQLEQHSAGGSSSSLLHSFPLAYPLKKEAAIGGEKPSQPKSLGRRCLKTPTRPSRRSLNADGGSHITHREPHENKASVSRLIRTGMAHRRELSDIAEPLNGVMRKVPAKTAKLRPASTGILQQQPRRSSTSPLHSKKEIELFPITPSLVSEAGVPNLLHYLKQNNRFCRMQTMGSVGSINATAELNSSSASSILSKSYRKTRKNSIIPRKRNAWV